VLDNNDIVMMMMMIVLIIMMMMSLITDSLQHIPAGKAGKVTGLIRVVHLLLQNKPMVSYSIVSSHIHHPHYHHDRHNHYP
jgi:hypothetical protein